DAFIDAAAPWPPERCSRLTGIPAETIRRLGRDFRNASGGCIYMSTGVNMGPFGSLAYWLVQGLHLMTGQLDRRGGLVVPRGAFDAFALARALGLGTADDHRTLKGGWHRVAGAFPVAALPEEIQIDHPERVRALFVSSGNPLHSTPGSAMEDALRELDLLVSIDLYQNETAKHADYLLPATDMLERSDFPVSWTALQPTPHAQYTPRVVSPRFERREEWRIFSDLAVACGAKAFGPSLCQLVPRINGLLGGLGLEVTPDHLLAALLRWGGQVSLAELRANPGGVFLEATEPGSFLGRRVSTPDGRVTLDAPRILADLPRLEAFEAEQASYPRDELLLIGRRERRSHNSWLHNLPRVRGPSRQEALLHPDDADARGIDDGAVIEICSTEGTIRLHARVTEDIARGVVAVPHGWGHQDAQLSHAAALKGGNINAVIPGGAMEPVSGQAIMLAHRVRVEPSPFEEPTPTGKTRPKETAP
ncbi:MAG: molybdopterin dinucleotide binding domain-containing protein, partial [Myxococcota bacterium]